MIEFQENCFNCKKIINVSPEEFDHYNISFCCIKCRDTYFENEILKVATKLDLDLFPHIENRFDILDL